MQQDEGDTDLMNFLPKDIKSEIRRCAKLSCSFCKKRGASIGCCNQKCKKKFHLTCGFANKCTSNFEKYESYCDLHSPELAATHQINDLCGICCSELGECHVSRSVQFGCCNDEKFYHINCLRKKAQEKGNDFMCPTCYDYDKFRTNMLRAGIFIPDHAAELDPYVSAEEEDIENEVPRPKSRRIHRIWLPETTFKTHAEATETVSKEGCWSKYFENKSKSNVTVTYRCNSVKFRGAQCEAGIRLVYPETSTVVELFRCTSPHTHDENSNIVFRFRAEEQQLIRELVQKGTKRKAISTALVMQGFLAPPQTKLQSFIKKVKAELNGGVQLHLGTLEQWLSETSVVPEDQTEPFILSYEINDEDETAPKFKFFVTTKILMQSAIGAKNVHSDATYKIVWEGYPILIVGTSDMHKKFHPFGVAVCTNETTADFEFVFKSLKTGLKDNFDVDFQPEYLISDAAKSIHKGFRNIFGDDSKVIMCWYHMKTALTKRMESMIKNQAQRMAFIVDINKLQVAKTREIFDTAANLFVKKWSPVSKELMTYFQSEWLSKNRNWYEAYARRTPSTNNCIESFNNVVKTAHTHRERLALSEFRRVLFDMIRQWAVASLSKLNVIHNERPQIDLKMWTNSYVWLKSNAKITSRRMGDKIWYRVTASRTEGKCI